MAKLMIRVVLGNGDVRQGRYLGHDREFLRIHDGYKLREIELAFIKDFGEVVSPKRYQACLEAS